MAGLNSKISIIIVTYNAADTLQKCLDSIYSQAYPDIEIVVIDGDSADATKSILQKNSQHIAYFKSEPDNGIYDAMNKALKHITGQWLYFLGADDELLPDFSKFADKVTDSTAIYYANVLHNGVKRSGQVSAYYMAKVGIYHQAIIYPKAVFERYHYDTKYKIAADYALNMHCFKDKTFHFVYHDIIIARYNHIGISATVADELFERDKAKLILDNFGFKIWLRFAFRLIKGLLRKNKTVKD